MRRFWVRAALGLLVGGSAAVADDKPKPKADPPADAKKADDGKPADGPKTPGEKWAAAKAAMDEANKTFQKVIQEMQSKGEKLSLENKDLKAAFEARNKTTKDALAVALAAGKADPKSDTGADALIFFVTNNPFGADGREALKLLAEHHAAHPKIGQVAEQLAYAPPGPDVERFLRAVMGKSTSREAKGAATLTLGKVLARSKATAEEGERLIEAVANEYKDVKSYRGTLADRAAGDLFEIRNLAIGKVAPDIEGEDTDGQKFKLSDYRGKVVVLDFWGHW